MSSSGGGQVIIGESLLCTRPKYESGYRYDRWLRFAGRVQLLGEHIVLKVKGTSKRRAANKRARVARRVNR